MQMKRFVQGEDRNQSTLLPERLDDFVTEDNPVRVIEASLKSSISETSVLRVSSLCRRADPVITLRRC